MTESPTLLLQRAADELERLAEHFAVYEEEQERSDEFPSASARWIHLNVSQAAHLPANEWMWMMTPAVAGPIAAMLRFDAMRLKWAARCEDVDKSYRGFELARLILGEAPSE